MLVGVAECFLVGEQGAADAAEERGSHLGTVDLSRWQQLADAAEADFAAAVATDAATERLLQQWVAV